MQETELFQPVKVYLEKHGYTVNAEVKNCDLVATKNEEMIIVEMKTGANMKLLVQATDRQRICDSVYVAIPHPKSKRRHYLGIQRVLKQLELGLLVVSETPLGSHVIKMFDPLPYTRQKKSHRKRSLITEIAERGIDYNVGGSTRTKLMTAYRKTAILIATCLDQNGPLSPKELRELGTGAKTQPILSSNHYGWFQRIDRGVYNVTDQGRTDIRNFPEVHNQCLRTLDPGSTLPQ